jgi:hypothetical protein
LRHHRRPAALGRGAWVQVGLGDLLPVAQQVAVAAADLVAWHADHPLDEVAVGGRHQADGLAEAGEEAGHWVARAGGLQTGLVVDEHDHVAVVDLAEAVGELLDQDTVGHVEGGLHRSRGDVEGGDQEGLEDDGEQDGEGDQHDRLADDRQHAGLLVGVLRRRVLWRLRAAVQLAGVVARPAHRLVHARAGLRFSLIFAALPVRSRR